jgi:hypothetical protein
MAYPTVSAPYGLKPVNAQGGRVYAGSTRMFPITNGYSTSLFNGDVVGVSNGAVVATGYNATTSTQTAGYGLGIFVGAEYSTQGGPIYGKNRYQYWNASVATNDALGYVIDDPLAYFRVAVLTQGTSVSNTPGSTIGYVNPAFVGSNAWLVTGNSGSTATGDSAQGVTGGAVTNGTGNTRLTGTSGQFRIIQVVPDTAYTYVSASTSTTSSGTSMTISAADSGIKAGMQFVAVAANGTYVSGCAPGNYNTVVNNNGTTTITLSSAIGASLSGATLTFIGYPEVIVGWNAPYHAYNSSTGV